MHVMMRRRRTCWRCFEGRDKPCLTEKQEEQAKGVAVVRLPCRGRYCVGVSLLERMHGPRPRQAISLGGRINSDQR